MIETAIEWYAGVDWGSEKHQACILDNTGEVVAELAFPHSGTGLAELCNWLASVAGDVRALAVAIEVPHGPVVDALIDRGFVVYAINPKQLDRLRDRFSVAGSKDDRRDARVAASGLRTDRHLFRLVQVSNPVIVELREWSRLAEELQQDRVRLCNRIRQQLWRYYPQLLDLVDDMAAEWLLELWTMAPTPAKATRLHETTVARLLKRHRIRRFDAAAVLDIFRRPSLKVADGVTEAAVLHLRSLITRLRLANREFRTAEKKLDELCTALHEEGFDQTHGLSDVAVLSSLPGIGRTTLAILIAEASGPLSRRDYAARRTLAGVAPVTKRSGKSPRLYALCRVPAATQRDPLSKTIPMSTTVTLPYVNAATHTAAPSVVSLIGCSDSHAPCSNATQYSIQITARQWSHNQTPSLCSTEHDISPSRPATGRAPRAGDVQDAASRHRRRAPARSVLDIASTVLCCARVGSTCHHTKTEPNLLFSVDNRLEVHNRPIRVRFRLRSSTGSGVSSQKILSITVSRNSSCNGFSHQTARSIQCTNVERSR